MADERIRREAEFHDRIYAGAGESRAAAVKYYPVFFECRAASVDKILEGAGGSRILEYGCGVQADAVRLAAAGAQVVGIDISAGAIEGTRASLPAAADLEFVKLATEPGSR